MHRPALQSAPELPSAADVSRLLEQVRTIVESSADGLSEHALIKALREDPDCILPEGSLSDPVILYRVHFLVFHALYHLRDRYRESREANLFIGPLLICREAYETGEAGLAKNDSLRRFYLDLDNLEASREEIEDLLARANQFLVSDSERAEALRTLELDEHASREDIRRRFRELAMRHHPDRGGDGENFKRICAAMELLTESRAEGRRH